MRLWRCAKCRKEWADVVPARGCPRCGRGLQPVPESSDGVRFGEEGFLPQERRRRSVVRAADLVRDAPTRCCPPCEGWMCRSAGNSPPI